MQMIPSLHSRPFGILPGGEEVTAWTLSGSGGLVLEVITYGGIVTRLLVPGREGELADVVLGFNDLESYLVDRHYFGAIIGRVAGRVAQGRLHVEGRTCNLSRNEPPHHLHGGYDGFNRRLWSATPTLSQSGESSLRLEYKSQGGEEGYPASVEIRVTYTVTHDNSFVIETEVTSDRVTPVNLTHHSYFNLAGESSGDIGDHQLQIPSDYFVPFHEDMTPSCTVKPVEMGKNDFRHGRRIGDAIPLLFRNHGDLYLVPRGHRDDRDSPLVLAAILEHKNAGRLLNVVTTESHLQLYTGYGLDGSVTGKSRTAYGRHAGLCIECQGPPIGMDRACPEEILVRPGMSQRRTTAYQFRTTA